MPVSRLAWIWRLQRHGLAAFTGPQRSAMIARIVRRARASRGRWAASVMPQISAATVSGMPLASPRM